MTMVNSGLKGLNIIIISRIVSCSITRHSEVEYVIRYNIQYTIPVHIFIKFVENTD